MPWERFIYEGDGAVQAIGSKLSRAYLFGEKFTVGLTGGSATAHQYGYPIRLINFFTEELNLKNFELRNAGHGGTSQLSNTPCINSFLGDNIDLLLWEFAINDALHYIQHDVPPDYPRRSRLIEIYMRQAISINPPIMGMINIWDIFVHHWNSSMKDLSDRAYPGSVANLHHYAPIYNSTFAIDLFGMLYSLNSSFSPSDVLMDNVHPNEKGYDYLANLFKIIICQNWIRYLNSITVKDLSSMLTPISIPRHERIMRLLQHPLLTKNDTRIWDILPDKNVYGHCFSNRQPQFGAENNSIKLVSMNDVTSADIGKHGTDRQDTFGIFKLGFGHLDVQLFAQKIKYIFVGCDGRPEHPMCRERLDVLFDGQLLKPNYKVDWMPPNDMFAHDFFWIHYLDPSIRNANRPIHNLTIRGLHENASFTTLAVWEDMSTVNLAGYLLEADKFRRNHN